MEPLIKEILADLYRVDPELKSREAELVKLVSRLLASRPDTDLDENFKRELRERLLAEFASSRPEKRPLASGIARFFATYKLGLAAGGALTAVVLAAVLIYAPAAVAPTSPAAPGTILSLGLQVTPTAEHAFGALGLGAGGSSADSGAEQRNAASGQLAAGAAPSAAPLGLGGGGGIGLKMAAPDTMPVYQQPVRYHFSYSGELAPPEAKVEVLKRETAVDTGVLAAVFSKLDLGLMDLGKLQDLAVQNINLAEDRDNGYLINLNFEDGSITINQNWSRWPQPKWDCPPEQGCTPPRIKQEDIPANEEILRIAAEFVGRMGIPTANYGAPKVDDSWRKWYAEAENKADYWFPEQVGVSYPMLVNGKKVYYNDGREAGLNVSIDVRTKLVTNVSPIYSQRYLGSDYAGETDQARILEVAAGGGIMPIYYYGEGEAKVIDVGLGQPEEAYYWHWNYQNGRSENLLVPALVFPVQATNETGGLYLERVVVPLAKEILDQAGQNAGPMPYLLKGGAADAGVGSAGTPIVAPDAEAAPASEPVRTK